MWIKAAIKIKKYLLSIIYEVNYKRNKRVVHEMKWRRDKSKKILITNCSRSKFDDFAIEIIVNLKMM